MLRRVLAFLLTTIVLVLGPTSGALACGFLVAPNGAIRLAEFTALAAIGNDGNTHYVTSFEFQGPSASFGSIIPLPDEPLDVEVAGEWTLQRLKREVTPPLPQAAGALDTAAAVGEAEVIATYEVEALDIAVLKGGGAEVLAWAEDNGFAVGAGEDPEPMLSFYADRSPYFAAIRYDLERAAGLERIEGDGTPVHFVFEGEQLWVPLRVLAFDKPDTELVRADVFLLTPERPRVLTGPEVAATVSQRAGSSLLDDLRDDRNSAWFPDSAWLTYYDVAVPAARLDYDLVATTESPFIATAAAFGLAHQAVALVPDRPILTSRDPMNLWALAFAVVTLVAGAGIAVAITQMSTSIRAPGARPGGQASETVSDRPTPT